MDIKTAEKCIRMACTVRTLWGWKIVQGKTCYYNSKCCCPLGAVGGSITNARKILDWTYDEAMAFVSGFDLPACIKPSIIDTTTIIQLGIKLRNEYINGFL